jgi:hypothetical protein
MPDGESAATGLVSVDRKVDSAKTVVAGTSKQRRTN